MTVLDASALLAYVLDEPGAELVEEALLDECAIGAVNLAEVLTKLSDAGREPRSTMEGIGVLPIDLVAFDDELAVRCAELRPLTVSAGLSLGDRACLALGRTLGRPVLTADGAWVGVLGDVDVRVIR
ncbi:MAG: type II toxin-antitoxin system VapC family toxin [Actinomycetota bacterium]